MSVCECECELQCVRVCVRCVCGVVSVHSVRVCGWLSVGHARSTLTTHEQMEQRVSEEEEGGDVGIEIAV